MRGFNVIFNIVFLYIMHAVGDMKTMHPKWIRKLGPAAGEKFRLLEETGLKGRTHYLSGLSGVVQST